MNQPPEAATPLNPETVLSVVEHMNDDHADACLTIVRAFSEQGQATQAKLVDIDRQGLLFVIQTQEMHGSADDQRIRINFVRPLKTESQIRGALVGLTRQARQRLSDQ